jgi:WD40 repeat protein
MKHAVRAAFLIGTASLMVGLSVSFVVAQPTEPRTCLNITPETPLTEQAVFPSLIQRGYRDSREGRHHLAYYPRWSPDGQWIGISYLENPLNHSEWMYLWNVASGEPELAFARLDQGAALWASDYSWSPDSTRLALNSNGTYSIITVKTGEQVMLNDGEWIAGRHVWSWDGSQVATLETDNTIRIWDAATGQEMRRIQSEQPIVTDVRIWPEQGLRWLTRDEISIVQVWEENSSEPIFTMKPDGSAWLSPSGRFIVTFGAVEDGVRIWDVNTGQLEQTLHAETYGILWTQDERCILTATDDPEMAYNFAFPQIWHVASGELVQSIDDTFEGIYNVTWSPDGTRLAYIDTDGAIHVWGLE